ncbi:MAG: hypothetical protein GEU97_21625 [Actinophytocola sp.]|nr:hypothetical protein [Actinophytocola sp.]
MENGLLLTLAVLACPVGMGAMIWLMMRGNKGSGHDASGNAQPTATDSELAGLRAELDQLKAERAQRPTTTGEHS